MGMGIAIWCSRRESLPLVGRVAHRERSERCDGWGLAHGSARKITLLKQPPTRPAFGRPPFPQRGRDKEGHCNTPSSAGKPMITAAAVNAEQIVRNSVS